jgi:hypothetical protein
VSALTKTFGHSRGVQDPFVNKIMCSEPVFFVDVYENVLTKIYNGYPLKGLTIKNQTLENDITSHFGINIPPQKF